MSDWFNRVEIRNLVESDLPALEWQGRYKHFRNLHKEIYNYTLKRSAMMWVANLDGAELIGQLFIQLNSGRSEFADGRINAYLFAFRVKTPYRGFGIGTKMLNTVEMCLHNKGFIWLTLNVIREEVLTRRFYEDLGFNVVAKEKGHWSYIDEKGYRQDIQEPSWKMKKKILAPIFVNI